MSVNTHVSICVEEVVWSSVFMSPSSKRRGSTAFVHGGVQGVLSRRRRAIGTFLSAVTFDVNCSSAPGRVSSNLVRTPRTLGDIVLDLSETALKRMLRMPWNIFNRLCNVIWQDIAHTMSFSRVELDVFITIRWLAGASYLDLLAVTGLPTSTLYLRIDVMLSMMDSALKLSFNYKDIDLLQEQSEGFSRNGRSPLRGCVGALDGLAIKIQEPSLKEVSNPSVYYNRKGFFALNMQALCDYKLRFQFVSLVTPGSSHDSMAFQLSLLHDLLQRDYDTLPPGFWIAADEAYVCTSKVLTPWPGRNIEASKDCFNYWLSSARITIEQAFGVLVGRWGILWRKLRLPLKKATQVVVVCCKLHNFIIDMTNSASIPNNEPGDVDGVTMEVLTQDECVAVDRRRRDLEQSVTRQLFTEEILALGATRPN